MMEEKASMTRGWSVVFAALAINLIIGALYAWSVIGKELVRQWQWTKTLAVLPFAVSSASFAITMIFAGRWQDRIGPRWVAMLGGIMFGTGLMLSSLARSPMLMCVSFGIIGGMGIGLGYSATTPPSIKWFPPARKGFITGIVVSGVGLAAVYMSPLTNYLLKSAGIQQTFLILGIGTVVLVCLLAQILANPPQGYSQAREGSVPAAVPGPVPRPRRELDWHEMLRTTQFYQLWSMFVLSASAGLLIIGNIVLIAQDQAPKWEKGFVLVMVVAIFNTCGRFVSGFLSDRIGRTNTMVLAFLLQAVNMFAFTHYTSPALLICGSAFTGLCYGTIFTLFPAATADLYGVRNLGVNYGFVFTAFGVAGVTGSLLGGKARDVLGSYSHAFTICAIMLLIGATLAFLLSRSGGGHAPPLPTHSGGSTTGRLVNQRNN